MSLKTFFMSVFPFLFNAIEVEFEKLPESEKQELIQAGQFGQILKQEFSKGYNAVLEVASSKLGLSKDTIDTLLTGLCKKFNVNPAIPANFIDHLQSEVNKGLEDSAWDALWTTVSGQTAVVAGGGKISWPVVAMGLIEFVYRKFVQGKF